MKRPDLKIIGIEEGEESQPQGPENNFNKNHRRKLCQPKERDVYILQGYRTSIELKEILLSCNNQSIKSTEQRKTIKSGKGKGQVTY